MKTVPLKRVATVSVSNVDKKSVDSDVPVRLCNYTDVYYRETITPDLDLMTATATPEQVRAFGLQANDVVITKDSETASDIGIPAFVATTAPDLVCGYHLAILRPDPAELVGRFLFWTMASRRVRDELAAAATGVTRFGLRTHAIGGLEVPKWSLQQQHAIGDYLDAETARIDALIAKKRYLIELKRPRFDAASF